MTATEIGSDAQDLFEESERGKRPLALPRFQE